MPKMKSNKKAEIKFPTIEAHMYWDGKLGPMTKLIMEDYLGYLEEQDGFNWGDNFLFKLPNGVKVRLRHNNRNRPFDLGTAEKYCQDILNGNWHLNGETFIFGESGECLSGQHRGAGLILAVYKWNNDTHYRKVWKTEPTIDALVVTGISEDPEVVRSIDNSRSRTLTDVMYCEADFGKNKNGKPFTPKERQQLCAMASGAVRYMWFRTVFSTDEYAKKRTHSEAMYVLDAHPGIKDCVKHIFGENTPLKDDDGKVMDPPLQMYTTPGYASGMMYLMGASATDPEHYAKSPTEKKVDWEYWDRALEFWSELTKGSVGQLSEVRDAVNEWIHEPTGKNVASDEEKRAIVVAAWNKWKKLNAKKKEGVKIEDVRLDRDEDYTKNSKDEDVFTANYNVGGIDLGNPGARDQDGDDEGEDEKETVTTKKKVAPPPVVEDQSEDLTPEEIAEIEAEKERVTQEIEEKRNEVPEDKDKKKGKGKNPVLRPGTSSGEGSSGKKAKDASKEAQMKEREEREARIHRLLREREEKKKAESGR